AGPQQPFAGGLLLVDRHRVLEVAQEDVDGRRDVGHLGEHLLVREVHEVDHPAWLERNLEPRVGGADRERLGEITGVTHGRNSSARTCRAVRCPEPMGHLLIWRSIAPPTRRARPTTRLLGGTVAKPATFPPNSRPLARGWRESIAGPAARPRCSGGCMHPPAGRACA